MDCIHVFIFFSPFLFSAYSGETGAILSKKVDFERKNGANKIYLGSIYSSMPSQFRSKNRAGFISGYQTTQNQGGGEKKAGLIPSVGNDSWGSLYKQICNGDGNCCTAASISKTLVFTKNTIRPTDTRPNLRMR